MHISFEIATSSHGGRADSHTSGGHSRLVAHNRVFVQGDVDLIAQFLKLRACKADVAHVHKHQVIVSASRHKCVAFRHQAFGKGFRVAFDLLNVVFELRSINFE